MACVLADKCLMRGRTEWWPVFVSALLALSTAGDATRAEPPRSEEAAPAYVALSYRGRPLAEWVREFDVPEQRREAYGESGRRIRDR